MATLADFNPSEIDIIIAETFKSENNLRSIEDAAKKLTQTVCQYFQTDGKSDFVLARVFQSISYQALPMEIQQQIKKTNVTPDELSRFLTLIGTYGDEKPWQTRQTSQGHQAIPLTEETLRTVPMVSRLFQQIGFDLGAATDGDTHALHMSGVSGLSGIFYVENAEGSPYIPGQDFVKKYGVQSVVGTGVMLPQNEIAAFIGFARVPLTKAKATILAPIMSKFWRQAFPLLNYGIFS